MSTLYLLQYNNYYNRTVKYYNTLNDYLTNILATNRRQINDINFFYNDQVNTIQTINYNAPELIPEKNYDYLLVDNDNYGLSRWFIIECKWNRKGQQILTLRRDLLVDFMGSYLTQPLFAEKGCILTGTSGLMPLIANPEDVSASQILKSTTNLDESNRAIVGYIDRTYSGNRIAMDVNTIYINSPEELGLDDIIGTTVWYPSGDNKYFQMGCKTGNIGQGQSSIGSTYRLLFNASGTSVSSTTYATNNYWLEASDCVWGNPNNSISDIQSAMVTAINTCASECYNDLMAQTDETQYKLAYQYRNIPIMIGETLYKLVLSPLGTEANRTFQVSKGVYETIKGALKANGFALTYYSNVANEEEMSYIAYGRYYQILLEEDTSTTSIVLDSVTSRTHCGQPYDIFYMQDSTKARQIASIIAARLYSSGALYDLQLLPYAPSTTGAGTPQSISYGGGEPVKLYWIKEVNATYPCTDYTKSYSTAIDYKVGCLCDTVRICSPNHANSWDFNPAQNGGVSGFDIRCTFKPFAPYIHIKPIFKWMYGTAYTTDPRGLICGGSFAFPFVTDKWANYQINNSAYFNAYERDIENLSTTQKYERIRDVTNIVTGTLQGGATGAGLGNYISAGNAGATIAGGVAGGVASLAGGIADYYINEKLRNEAMDYRQDMFGFNSRNMIMSPRSLARTDSFDIDWNGPAYIEFYSASDGEKEAIKNKLKYNGWSLNVIVSTSNTDWYTAGIKTLLNNARTGQSNYVKGKLIYTTQYDDTHVFNELANEWFKGFYWDTSNGVLT